MLQSITVTKTTDVILQSQAEGVMAATAHSSAYMQAGILVTADDSQLLPTESATGWKLEIS